ncbi:Scd6-like Sm domain-containing protein [Schizothecium vesticola]|uniref:Scd6-like Sm domain-containing protein n=1 Tax=Schizothecium vesticola TaxID=314040 RepID=A0AA40JZE0_9PEZI|nr:Scd6-like Sm domain-containing protein [Schizothecium vesticola]
MSEFIGARISLISVSDIRYAGILHEINSEESTVSLQNVKSFGSEGRRGNPDDEVPASDQIYDYIVFRGTDVKDLRIDHPPEPPKQNRPPVMPNDPAIVGSRPRPGNVAPGPPGPPGPGPGPGPGLGPNHGPGPHGMPNQQGPPPGAPGFGYYPPPMAAGWGRAGPPGPGAFGGMPGQYPPPPQWYPAGGPDFQQPPMGPGGWNNYPYPPGPHGHPGPPTGPGPAGRMSANHTPNNQAPAPKPAPIGPSADRKPATPAQQPGPSEPKPSSQPVKQAATTSAPTPPVESKPSLGEVRAAAASLPSAAPAPIAQQGPKAIPTGPKITRPGQILPAVPLPTALTSRNQPQAQSSATKPVADPNSAAAALRDATQAAKAAVASAMAALVDPGAAPPTNGNTIDNLSNKVNEMRVGAPRPSQPPSRGSNNAGRGRGPRPTKVEVPASDFDFASSNAKFNKQELVKEAVSGSPSTETPVGQITPDAAQEASSTNPPAYNKSTSFFDNISSEAKDRSENSSQKPGGREWRGEEQRKNMETFGQGSVDGGYRGYRGRGRGRGGRGRGYRGGRGNAGSYPSQTPQ